MAKKQIPLTNNLRQEYLSLFETMRVKDKHAKAVTAMIARIRAGQSRYESVQARTAVPWRITGIIHGLECSCDFRGHLHNGDPLSARTVKEPAGRPIDWDPRKHTWEDSAVDALTFKRFNRWTDWSVPGMLYFLERYNGMGHRLYHPEVLTPYLWSFSNHYTRGKYVGDGDWEPDAVSKQVGAALLLKGLEQ